MKESQRANTGFNQTTFGGYHRYRKSLIRLLKVCYVPTTSAVLIAFFSFFLMQPSTVLMKQTRQPVRAIKQSIYLGVYGGYQQNLNLAGLPSKYYRGPMLLNFSVPIEICLPFQRRPLQRTKFQKNTALY